MLLDLDGTRVAKPRSRIRLLNAAAAAFCSNGYFAVSVEDIAAQAGVSRMTFYRNFSSKAGLAIALFEANVAIALPRVLSITKHAKLDRTIVEEWLADVFEADRASGQLLRVFIQANVEESGFTEAAQKLIGTIIDELGKKFPAFALDRKLPDDRKRWLEAWLLVYEILDQSNHAALGTGVATDPMIIEILAGRFLRFLDTAA